MSRATSATFVYDGDGTLVKSVLNGVTTDSIGTHFEWTDNNSGDGAPSCVLPGGHPPASTPGDSGKIAALCLSFSTTLDRHFYTTAIGFSQPR